MEELLVKKIVDFFLNLSQKKVAILNIEAIVPTLPAG